MTVSAWQWRARPGLHPRLGLAVAIALLAGACDDSVPPRPWFHVPKADVAAPQDAQIADLPPDAPQVPDLEAADEIAAPDEVEAVDITPDAPEPGTDAASTPDEVEGADAAADVPAPPDVTADVPSPPDFSLLCKACSSQAECGGNGAWCLQVDQGPTRCVTACDKEGSCPTGFGCTTETPAGGVSIQVCEPAPGYACPCLPQGAETCDGIDNDCNSQTDESGCDDGDVCTQDSCVAATCVHAVLSQVPCDDGLACTAGDQCANGACVGVDIQCDDGDACTFDSCNGGSCLHTVAAGAACSDGSACTLADVCGAAGCAGTPLPCNDGNPCTVDACDTIAGCVYEAFQGPCDDQNPCTSADHCMGGGCWGGQVLTCTALDACHDVGVCDSSSGQCSNPPKIDGVPCDDGAACTSMDLCKSGTCAGTPYTCPAPPDACHVPGVCKGEGSCSFAPKPDGSFCSDGNACTQTDGCVGGACVGANIKTCTALDLCHAAGKCDPDTGVCSQLFQGDATPCDDGNACTTGEMCLGGVCTAGINTCACTTENGATVCNDNNSCTYDYCALVASTMTCKHTIQGGSSCDDGNPCTVNDLCSGSACAGMVYSCAAPDACHMPGTCLGDGTCTFAAKADATACDDANACTKEDQCKAGICSGSSYACAPQGQCQQPGVCSGDGTCTYAWKANSSTCNDGNACTTVDICISGLCTGHLPKTCTASDACHDAGTCDASTGLCSNPNKADGSDCSDGNACTLSDSCQGGTCTAGSAKVCAAADACHAVGTCDVATGACSTPALANGSACSDGNACTKYDSCQGGSCVSGGATACTALDACHNAGTCEPATGVCSNPNKADGSACNDGNACSQGDACGGGTCAGVSFSCASADGCHEAGICQGDGTCSYAAKSNGSACSDGNPCTEADQCSGGTCVGGANTCACTVLNAASVCDDGNPCTNESCVDGGGGKMVCAHQALTNVSCTDGNACTLLDVCKAGVCTGESPKVCVAWDQCHLAGSCDPVSGSCSNPDKPAGSTCSDANACTNGDQCQAGSCVPGTAKVCGASDQCHMPGTCDIATGLCSNPVKGDGLTCSDGNACTLGDQCIGGTCQSGTAKPCTALDSCHSIGTCAPSNGVCSQPVKADGAACDDANACTAGDTCKAGLCGGSAVSCDDGVACSADPCDPASGCKHFVDVTQEAYVKASNAMPLLAFGGQVAADGDTMVVSTVWETSSSKGVDGDQSAGTYEDSGAAYVFVRQDGTWKQQAYLKPSNTSALEQFGISVAISGDTIAVGSLWDRSLSSGIGASQAALVGSPPGGVYVFVRSGATWTQQAYVKAANSTGSAMFGESVALSGDTLVVGAGQEGGKGAGVDAKDADQTAMASGAAFVFTRKDATWSQTAYLKASNAGDTDFFGTAVDIDGDTIVVGARGEASGATGVGGDQTDNSVPFAGAAYVFVRSGATWVQQAYLKPSYPSYQGYFGFPIAVSGDLIAVGASRDNNAVGGINPLPDGSAAVNSGAVYTFARKGTTWSTDAYIKAKTPGDQLLFGDRLSLDGATLAIGYRFDKGGSQGINANESAAAAPQSGAAFVYTHSSSGWTQRASLKASNAESFDFFGSVAVSGATVVVGAPGEDSASTGSGGNQADNSAIAAGAAYVFRLATASSSACDDGNACSTDLDQLASCSCAHGAKADATPCSDGSVCTTGDACSGGACKGSAVSCDDGVSCSADACSATAGCLHALEAGLAAYAKASNPGVDDEFGTAIAIEGNTMVVGAPGEDSGAKGVGGDGSDDSATQSGAAYVFERTAGVWSLQAYLKASNTEAKDGFGSSVAISGDTIAIGAPAESSSATGVGGNQLDNTASGSGAVYTFVRKNGLWSLEAYLKASNTGAGDAFGFAVRMDGETIVVSAPWEDGGATGVGGNQADESATDSGAVYAFQRQDDGWKQAAYIKASNTGAGDNFGTGLGLDGLILAVGAQKEDSGSKGVGGVQADESSFNSGAVYVFFDGLTAWSQQAYLKASNAESGDLFGQQIAVWGDFVVVGAAGEDSSATGVGGNEGDNSAASAGAAYVFARSGKSWSQQAYLKASNSAASDGFGGSLSIFGNTIVVGATGEDSAATGIGGNSGDNSAAGAGAAYAFVRSGQTWKPWSYLKASNSEGGDGFGVVALFDSKLAVGARWESSAAAGIGGNQASNAASHSGAAYVFALSSGGGSACDDGNPCTVDSSSVSSCGCLHASVGGGLACSDANPCTWADTCSNGICSGPAASCDDGLACTADSCQISGGCTHTMTCDDANSCTFDLCDAAGCSFPKKAEGFACTLASGAAGNCAVGVCK